MTSKGKKRENETKKKKEIRGKSKALKTKQESVWNLARGWRWKPEAEKKDFKKSLNEKQTRLGRHRLVESGKKKKERQGSRRNR